MFPLRTYALYLTAAWGYAGDLGRGEVPPAPPPRRGEEGAEEEAEELEVLKVWAPLMCEFEPEELREREGEAEEGLWGSAGTPLAAAAPLSSAARGLPGPVTCPTVAEGWMRRQLGPQRKMARRGPDVIRQTCTRPRVHRQHHRLRGVHGR